MGAVLRRIFWPLLVYACIAAAVAFLYTRIPSGFLPEEDQGVLFVLAQLPAGPTTEQSQGVLEKIEQHFLVDEKESVENIFGVWGSPSAAWGRTRSWASSSSRIGIDARPRRPDRQPRHGRLHAIQGSLRFRISPPAVIELGNATALTSSSSTMATWDMKGCWPRGTRCWA